MHGFTSTALIFGALVLQVVFGYFYIVGKTKWKFWQITLSSLMAQKALCLAGFLVAAGYFSNNLPEIDSAAGFADIMTLIVGTSIALLATIVAQLIWIRSKKKEIL